MSEHDVVIAAAARTPIGGLLGSLASQSAPSLGAVAISETLRRAGVSVDDVNEVIMGQVLQGGVGQAPARQAALASGIKDSTPCTTVNKVCGSGLKAIMMARQSIRTGDAKLVVAGGMESMSNAPHLLRARNGLRMGNGELIDSMIHDGLWDPYGQKHMGMLGELCASKYEFSREAVDAYAIRSYERARQALENGATANEIAAVTITSRRGDSVVETDDEPGNFRPEKIPSLRPAFDKEGVVTAANASKISDGAAAVVVVRRDEAERLGLPIIARIVADATFAQHPDWFTTAPVGAVRAAADRAEMSVDDIQLFEINEAFAVVAMAAMEELKLGESRINVHGGAISLGHPIGCSGARILVTLLHAMNAHDKSVGCASLCLGGGEAVAMIVERETN